MLPLTLPKSKGGIGLLAIQRYYWACHLARVVELPQTLEGMVCAGTLFPAIPLSPGRMDARSTIGLHCTMAPFDIDLYENVQNNLEL